LPAVKWVEVVVGVASLFWFITSKAIQIH
jgi:hypothetical protein